MNNNKELQNKVLVEGGVAPSELQIMLRRGLLEKASVDTKAKFTGDGAGANHILREDAEHLVCTVMAIFAAWRNNTEVKVEGQTFYPSQYVTAGNGVSILMNWSGDIYFSTRDFDDSERNVITRNEIKYVNDSELVITEEGREFTKRALGKVLTPEKFISTLNNYNAHQSKSGNQSEEIKIGPNVDKKHYLFTDCQYLYIDGELRDMKDSTETANSMPIELAMLTKPNVRWGLATGRSGHPVLTMKILNWLW
jgi:hypothetical protein